MQAVINDASKLVDTARREPFGILFTLLTTSSPRLRTSSIVPASTIDTYGMAQFGEYCIATRRRPEVSLRMPSTCSVQLE